jgi:radical SAM superfamily enzyme YgiQ (UPF0313 family)
VLLIAKEIKNTAPNIPIIFGGPQASILPDKTLKTFPFVDFILIGEADLSFPLFLAEMEKTYPDFTSVPGLVYRNERGDIKHNRFEQPIQNLDNLPFPAYHLFPKQESIKLDVGRGCPFMCTYCSTNNFFSKTYRVKSVDRIIQEMITIYEELNIRHFGFAHDMFTLNKKIIFDLCYKLIDVKNKKGIEFIWTCSARIDCVTDEMLIQMQKAGCQSIFFGIETGSEKIQKEIQKNLDVSKAFKIADLCRTIGLNMYASFILGFPEEKKTDIEKTLQTIMKLVTKGVFVQISELTLLPGTQIFNKHRNKLKLDGKFSNFSYAICGQQELKLIHQYPQIFSSFYYLPVSTLSRNEIVFLNQLINCISLFQNTLFLLSENIEQNLKSVRLLQLLKLKYINVTSENMRKTPIVSHWISIISAYIRNNQLNINTPHIHDILNYEAYKALLMTLYSGWRLVHPKSKKSSMQSSFFIKPTPVWKVLTTSYKLERIIPSENKWNTKKSICRRGTYHYLIVAISAIKYKRIKINTKEVYLLENLSELTFKEHHIKIKSVLNKKDTLLWIKKLRRFGVLEISE